MSALDLYSGPWTERQVVHLYHRAVYGASIGQIKKGVQQGLLAATDELFRDRPMPNPPINVNYATDPDVPIGETWVDKGTSANVNGYRNASLRAWSLKNIYNSEISIIEKMLIFWHNHFVTADINDPRLSYIYIQLLRSQALGNFKTLAEQITIDPAMLNYLNGRDNTNRAPNENYARELMELFTLGKGELAGPGDYTTFTEQDVKEIARALTGWIDTRNILPISSEFRAGRHDTGTKTLSHRFGNITIANGGADEYKNVINIIFNRTEVATFLVTKLYRWFVNTEVTDTAYQEVILPLAEMLRKDQYVVKNVLKTLLSSNHFYEDCNVGVLIKDPITFVMNPTSTFEIDQPQEAVANERAFLGLYASTFSLQMGMYQCPAVAGWQPTYQSPVFGKLWLNSTTLPLRKKQTDFVATTSLTYSTNKVGLDVFKILKEISDPSDANVVVTEFTNYTFPFPLEANQIAKVVELLIPSNWKTIYSTYAADPQNTQKQLPVINRMRQMLMYVMRMPEFHLY